MSERDHNANDPNFLLSRSLDEKLHADEQRTLDESIKNSAELGSTGDAWRRLMAMLTEWGRLPPNIDEEPYVRHVMAQVADVNDEGETADADALLEHVRETPLPYDDDAFVRGVMKRVRAIDHTPTVGRHMRRLAWPLAAAAAVAFAVVGGMWHSATEKGTCLVEYRSAADDTAAGGTADRNDRLVVAYARTTDRARSTVSAPRVAFISFGADSPTDDRRLVAPPL